MWPCKVSCILCCLQQTVSAVLYIKAPYVMMNEVSFEFGKVKLVTFNGHSMPILELCTVLMAVKIVQTVKRHLNISFVNTLYSDSKTVLGYINYHTSFYNYVANCTQFTLFKPFAVELCKIRWQPSWWKITRIKYIFRHDLL